MYTKISLETLFSVNGANRRKFELHNPHFLFEKAICQSKIADLYQIALSSKFCGE